MREGNATLTLRGGRKPAGRMATTLLVPLPVLSTSPVPQTAATR
jgi:hypothetical protein